VLAEGADLGIEGTWIDQTAHIPIGHQRYALKHIDILEFRSRTVNSDLTASPVAYGAAASPSSFSTMTQSRHSPSILPCRR
jgi:hypothetical protein